MFVRSMQRGDRGPDVWQVHRRLMARGYLEGGDVTAFVRARPVDDDGFDEHTDLAVRVFQERNGLPVTGIVDRATHHRLSRGFCGHPDRGHGGLGYSVQGRWDASLGTDLKWFSDPPTLKGIDAQTVRDQIRKALAEWQRVAPSTFKVKFSEAARKEDAQIRISYVSLGDTDPLVKDTLADAQSPHRGTTSVPVRFDTDNQWNAAQFLAVATHEFGHALGLGHTTDLRATMFPEAVPGQESIEQDDIDGFAAAYGATTDGLVISNPSPVNCSWFVYNADDTWRGVALESGDLLSSHSEVYHPPDAVHEKVLVRFTFKGGGTLLASGTAKKKGQVISLVSDGSCYAVARS